MNSAYFCKTVSAGQSGDEPPQVAKQQGKNTGRKKNVSFSDNELSAGKPGGNEHCEQVNEDDVGKGNIGKGSVDKGNENTDNAGNIAAQPRQQKKADVFAGKGE
jgi:hypothetical protein